MHAPSFRQIFIPHGTEGKPTFQRSDAAQERFPSEEICDREDLQLSAGGGQNKTGEKKKKHSRSWFLFDSLTSQQPYVCRPNMDIIFITSVH